MSLRLALNTTRTSRARLQREPKMSLIMDSGAFSAWKSGNPINLEEYCDFLLRNEEWITHSVALDVINPSDTEKAASESYNNYIYMRSRGLRPIPVWHVGESVTWLYRLLDAGADYIGLSASSIVAGGAAEDWYALAWSYLVDTRGTPTIRAHAFGEGRAKSLMRFPFYSADTTTWLYSAQRSGTIQFGDIGDSRRLSFRNDGFATRAQPDITRLKGSEHDQMIATLASVGLSERLLDERDSPAGFVGRCYASAQYYIGLQRRVSAKCPILYSEARGLDGFMQGGGTIRPPVHIPDFKLYMVVGSNNQAKVCMAVAGHPYILASYFYVNKGRAVQELKEYVYDPMGTIQQGACLEIYNQLRSVML
jgi:hypothetical protein